MRLTRLSTALLILMLPAGMTAAADANPFAAVATVNERAITNYELSQRIAFLQLLNGPGDHHDEALKGLISDRLQMTEAARLGITVTDAQIKAGEDEFAARAKLATPDFIAQLNKAGVATQTLRDFVEAGLAWRAVVGGVIAPRVTVTAADVKDAQALSLAHGVPRVLLSELVLPATPEYIAQTGPLADQLSKTLHGDAAFSAAAQKYSASASAKQGGKLDWLPTANLPPAVLTAVLSLSPGQVTSPMALPNALVLFEMRGLEDAAPVPSADVSVDYMEYLIPGGHSAEALAEAARIKAKAHSCDDVYGAVKGTPPDQLTRTTQKLAAVPTDIGYALAKLDPGEVSTDLTRGSALVYLMLCSRIVTPTPPLTEDQMRAGLFDQRVNGLANVYLAKLRAAAIITTQ
ncbi:chaperone SurA precursor [mine drainage metagenome]|uniref:Chaperone SurA n=1 Tax=mine drainage metagenome TaxID=410659 RepID=A0A1J5PCU7_9ZZZZ